MLDLLILRNRPFVGQCLATVTPFFGFFYLPHLPAQLLELGRWIQCGDTNSSIARLGANFMGTKACSVVGY